MGKWCLVGGWVNVVAWTGSGLSWEVFCDVLVED